MPQASRAPVGVHTAPLPNREPRIPLSTRHGQSTSYKRAETYRYLRYGLPFSEVARYARVSRATSYRIHTNLIVHGSLLSPRRMALSRPLKLTPADKDTLFKELL
jgi:hypothetical protein